MSIVEKSTTKQELLHTDSNAIYHIHWRLPVLCVLLLCSIIINIGFLLYPSHPNGPVFPFMLFFWGGFGPYLAACGIVLTTRAQRGRWRWLELGLILGGALVLRAMLLHVEPFLSPDSWRYLWDARVTLHGYSPYVYGPGDPILTYLRDANYYKMAFHNVPSIYPPGAQAIYIISYLLAPENLMVLKTIFMFFDLLTCAALAYWLNRRGLDPSRAIIYAWCPLPIIDFAIQGHLDVLAISFSLLAMIANSATWRGSRVLTGLLIGLATLAKIYPILLLVAVIRRRDWALLASCLAIIFIGYLPYILLGHGQVFGFFAQYADEHSPNSGPFLHVINWITNFTGFRNTTLEHILEAVLLGGVGLSILWLRQRERISVGAAILALIGTLFIISSHVFPWYATALLPWVAVEVQPVWIRREGLQPGALAVAMAWYFLCIATLHYLFDRLPNWTLYYVFVYGVVLIGLGIAAWIGIKRRLGEHQRPKRGLSNT